jgi:hypothetical protein
MEFGIYVHTAGSTWFDSVATALSNVVQEALRNIHLNEVDGLYFSFHATDRFASGIKTLKRKERHNYTMKVITGGSRYYRCLVEFDAEVADAELVSAASSEPSLFSFVQATVLQCLPMALPTIPAEQLTTLRAAVSQANLPYESRW